jgi:dipeptidyl aminopeptidase/acylaminoacyl peptidase
MRPLVARDLLALRTYGQPAVHPDGRWVALVERRLDAAANRNHTRIVRWDLEPPFGPPRPLTVGPADERPAFSPDGRTLAFLARRDEPYRQLYLLPLDGGEAVRATDVDGGVRDVRWLPDGSGLVLVCMLEDDRILPVRDPDAPVDDPFERYTRDVKVIDRMFYKLDGEGFFGRRRAALCLYDCASGGVQLIAGGPYDHALAYVEPDGRATVAIANRGPDPDRERPVRDLWRFDHAGGAPERLTDLALGIDEALRVGETVYAVARIPAHHGYGGGHLVRVDAGGGGAADLTAAFDGSVGDESAGDVPLPAGPSLFADGDGGVYALWSQGGRVGVARLGEDGRLSTVAGGDRVICAAAAVGDALVVCATDPTHPGYVAYERAGETLARVEATPDWDALAAGLTRPVPVAARAAGGPPLDAWYLPPATDASRAADGRVAAVLEIHGGPASMYGHRFMMEFHLLAAAGYGVVYANPRGSLGYGDAFCRDIEGDWGHHDYEDVIAALDGALAAHPDIDPGRLGVAGGSYGGFMVNWIVGHTDRFRAAVTMRSVVNRMSAMGTSDVGYQRVPQFDGKLWWEDPAPYLHQSPLMWASNVRTPLLIEHQEGDLRCPIDQGEQLYIALKVLGREVVFVRYPEESHGMSRTGKPWHRVHRLITLADWFDRHLKPRHGEDER